MDDLIEALTILRKYANPRYPVDCAPGVLHINVSPVPVSREDLLRLKELNVYQGEDDFHYSWFGGH